jgi:glycine cleavage system P protein (glycine dehydrogenase) subunit 1
MQRCRYAMQKLAVNPGLKIPFANTPHFTEFVVNFDATQKTTADVNQALLAKDIFGGKDLSSEFPGLGQSLLLCVSEIHTRADLDRLAAALKEVLQ